MRGDTIYKRVCLHCHRSFRSVDPKAQYCNTCKDHQGSTITPEQLEYNRFTKPVASLDYYCFPPPFHGNLRLHEVEGGWEVYAPLAADHHPDSWVLMVTRSMVELMAFFRERCQEREEQLSQPQVKVNPYRPKEALHPLHNSWQSRQPATKPYFVKYSYQTMKDGNYTSGLLLGTIFLHLSESQLTDNLVAAAIKAEHPDQKIKIIDDITPL